MKWEPIDTAPRDADVITWHSMGVRGGYVQIQRTIARGQMWPSEMMTCGSVTHWMPLPPPPEAIS